jgi:hypothetical protein
VTVNLYDTSGTLIATTVTDAGGNYTFGNLPPNTSFVIRLDNAADYSSTGPLAGMQPTLPDTGGNDAADSDATLPTTGLPIGPGNYPTIPVVTTGPGGSNTPTYDIGFWTPLSLGNRVWYDANNNGLIDTGEIGFAGVTVNLLDTGGNVIASTTTNAQGYYLFTNLLPGTYVVQLPASNFQTGGPLAIYTSSTGTLGQPSGPYEGGTSPDPNNGADQDDNGNVGTAGLYANGSTGGVVSKPVTLGPIGSAPVSESGGSTTPGITDPASDANSNLTLDFGITEVGKTPITVVSFTATRQGGKVVLTWTTSAELNTAGFTLYRSADRSRVNAVQVTPKLIPARGGGTTYTWTDTSPLAGGYYWLQEVGVFTQSNEFGPVAPAAQATSAYRILLPLVMR